VIFDGIETGSRAAYREDSRSESHAVLSNSPRKLSATDNDLVIDAEVMDEGDELIAAMRSRPRDADGYAVARGSENPEPPDGDGDSDGDGYEPPGPPARQSRSGKQWVALRR
jgi:hypothetical protein